MPRRKALAKKLNAEFAKAVAQDYTQEEAYGRLVNLFSYKLLHGFTYAKKPSPFKSGRCIAAPPDTDGSIHTNLLDWENLSNSPVIYVKNCLLYTSPSPRD